MKRLLVWLCTAPLLVGCGGSSAASQAPIAPVTPLPAATTHTPTPAAPSRNARGNLVKEIGQLAGSESDTGERLVDFKVTAIEPNFTCTGEFAQESKNGNFIAISMEIQTSEALERYQFFVDEYHWKVIGPDGTTENDSTGNAWMCLEASEKVSSDIGPGERLVGKVVLDSKHTSGALVLTQPGMGGGWEWSFA